MIGRHFGDEPTDKAEGYGVGATAVRQRSAGATPNQARYSLWTLAHLPHEIALDVTWRFCAGAMASDAKISRSQCSTWNGDAEILD